MGGIKRVRRMQIKVDSTVIYYKGPLYKRLNPVFVGL
jgi:hypothetical protein